MQTQAQRGARAVRGTAWLEILISLTLLLPLALLLVSVFRSGSALVATASAYGTNRANLAELAWRWQNEAATAWAIFTPQSDALGEPNCASRGCHEVDFFTRDTNGTAHFWAWRYDPAAGTLQRYTYADPRNPGATLSASGPPLGGVTSFTAQQLLASELKTPPLAGYVPKDVSLNLGFPSVNGGNALMVLDVANASEHIVREYLPATTPSGFTVIVGTFTPPPNPPGGAINPCGLTLAGQRQLEPPAPPACIGHCTSCTQTGPPLQIRLGSEGCTGAAGRTWFTTLPSATTLFTYWSPDGSNWQFYSRAATGRSQGETRSGSCTTWFERLQATTTYWDHSGTSSGTR